MVEFRKPKTWRKSTGVKGTDLNRELRDQIRRIQTEVTILQSATGGSVESGTILPFPGDTITIPSGWLLCDGRQVPKATYPNLWVTVGTSYGPATTNDFSLPDFRGKMLRGNPVSFEQQIQGRGFSSGATSPRTDTLIANMSFTGNMGAAGGHTHTFDLNHRHAHSHAHDINSNNASHTHGYNSHSHNTSGPSATRNNGSGNVQIVAQGTHGHNAFSTGFGSANSDTHFHNGDLDFSGANVNNSGDKTSSSEADHTHGSIDHTHSLSHSHTIDTTPAYLELNFLVKT